MAPFRFAHATDDNWLSAANACLAQLGTDPSSDGDGPLGLVYVTDTFAGSLAELLAHLKERTGVVNWIGSVGMGICATGQEYFDRPGLVLMIADLAPGSYRVFSTVGGDLEGFGEANGAWAAEHDSRFAIVHADPRNPKIDTIVTGLAGALDGFLVGGITSSRGPLAQVAGGITEGGVSGVLLAADVPVVTALSQSCWPIGDSHEVTECDSNVLIELDDRPALEVFKDDIGELMARDLQQVAGRIFAALPVPGSDTGDYMVRNLVGIDVQQKLVAIGELIERGQAVRFCRRDPEAAEKDLVRMVDTLKRRAGGQPRGAVYYSCLARGPNMFGEESRELKLIERELGDVPLVGFFCNGEISHNRLYGYTGVLTLFL